MKMLIAGSHGRLGTAKLSATGRRFNFPDLEQALEREKGS